MKKEFVKGKLENKLYFVNFYVQRGVNDYQYNLNGNQQHVSKI